MSRTPHTQGYRRRTLGLEYGLLGLLVGFTTVAVVGYYTFALNTNNLARVIAIPGVAQFYRISFPFFAQIHVWLTSVILAIALYRRRVQWVGAFAGVYVISLCSELVGTSFGWPFGEYAYTDLLGGRWFGRVPFVIPLSWFTMALPAYALAAYVTKRRRLWQRVLLGASLLTLWDLALDPAMSRLTPYWVWGRDGAYYGMPLVNLGGWFATGLVLMTWLSWSLRNRIARMSILWVAAYYAAVLLLPLGMVAAGGLWGAAIATTASVGAALWLVYYSGRRRGTKSTMTTTDVSTPASNPTNGTSAQPRRDVAPTTLEAFFRHHSRSFSFSARWFSKSDRKIVSYLYAFCRLTDDIADKTDNISPCERASQLDAWRRQALDAYRGIGSGLPWLDELMRLSGRRGVPFQLIDDLIDGVRTDIRPHHIEDFAELDDYCYRVASVVGIWLCHLQGIHDPVRIQQAASLGRAMQLTNILRDVGEDFARNRIYLPRRTMERFGVDREDLHAFALGQPPNDKYKRLIVHLMNVADEKYSVGWAGISSLPKRFGQAAAVAAGVYQGIHREIRRNDFDNFQHRARTGSLRKVVIAATSLWRRKRTPSTASPIHNVVGRPIDATQSDVVQRERKITVPALGPGAVAAEGHA